MNEPAQACSVFPLTAKATGPKTLKRKGFENQLEWSKTCEFFVVSCFYIPQETRP